MTDVDDGLINKSVIKKGKIHYNSIKVNGKELTIKDPNNSKSLIKSNRVLDTGNPLNAWDGSVVDTTDGLVSVDTKNYRINFPGIEDPKTIEVNFTLSDLINYDKKTIWYSVGVNRRRYRCITDCVKEMRCN